MGSPEGGNWGILTLMFIQVKLLKGFPEPLLYEAPKEWPNDLIGRIVRVPIRNQIAPAVVLSTYAHKPYTKFKIKQALAVEPFPQDPYHNKFVHRLSDYYQVHHAHFLRRISLFLTKKETTRKKKIPKAEVRTNKVQKITLTPEQQKVVDFLTPNVITPTYTSTVLHGVTGSGKTEIYKKLFETAFQEQKSMLLLLPEVSLAIQFEKIMREQLSPEIPICGFHSGTSIKNKKLLWHLLLEKIPTLIIGVHLPVLLPISNLGLIVVDEEHESGYQEKKHPKVNSKEAAIMRAHLNNIPILLGSATPSISSLFNVKTKGWNFFQLKKRFAGAFPTIETVFLNEKSPSAKTSKDKWQRRNFWITKKLSDEIKDRLHKKEQIIIFLNRRGFSFFVQCKECSFIFECKNCSVSLTLHGNNKLSCHYCGLHQQLPPACPSCKVDEKKFLKKGIGTQQVVTILEKLFPQARIGRADLDITAKKKLWQEMLEQFEAGELDILVGTQTITKGYHFPNVTLVGILWADLNLHFPIYNAAETTLQQLIQVAGRAGRQRAGSKVIVQTMMDHKIFQYLNEIDYLKFYEKELESRQMIGYPPYKRLVEIELKHGNEETIEHESMELMQELLQAADTHEKDVQILGPAKPPVSRIKRTHHRKIYLKAKNIHDIATLFQTINQKNYASSLFFTPNPTS